MTLLRRSTLSNLVPLVVLGTAIALLCGLPLGWLVWQLATRPEVWGEAWGDEFRRAITVRTMLYNGLAAGGAVLFAIAPAIVAARRSGVLRHLVRWAMPLGLVVPAVVWAYGWREAWRLSVGEPRAQSMLDVFRCGLMLAAWLWPIPAAAMAVALSRLPRALIDLSRVDGARKRTVARLLVGPAVAGWAGALLLASQTSSVWEPTGIMVTAVEVRAVFDTGAFSQGVQVGGSDQAARTAAAVATGLPTILLTSLAALGGWWLFRRSLRQLSDIADPETDPPARGSAVVASGAVLVLLFTLGTPLWGLIATLDDVDGPMRAWDDYHPQVMGSFAIATRVALASAAVILLALPRPPKWLIWPSVGTFLVGGQLLAIAWIRLIHLPWPQLVAGRLDALYDDPAFAAVVQLSRFAWLPLAVAMACDGGRWMPLKKAAAVDGATPVRTAWHVILPLAWPGLVAAVLLAFALSLTETPATVLLQPMSLIPVLMTNLHTMAYPTMAGASLLVVAIVAGLSLLVLVSWAIATRRWKALAPAAGVVLVLLTFTGCDSKPAEQPVAVYAERGNGDGQLLYPRAMCATPDHDGLWVIDRTARVQLFDEQGKFVRGWQMPDQVNGKPVGISTDESGNVWVPDTHYHRVIVYSPAGEELFRFGEEGQGPGQFIYPTDIVFHGEDVYVAEYGGNDRVQVFDRQGNFKRQFGGFGNGDGQFRRPQSMAIVNDELFVLDACNHRLVIFDLSGTFRRNLGGESGDAPGSFRFPYGLAVAEDGNLLVCEYGNNRLQKIDPQTGKALAVWGQPGSKPGELRYPWAVALDHAGRPVVADSGNNRLQVVGM